jgi:hypothetical protein
MAHRVSIRRRIEVTALRSCAFAVSLLAVVIAAPAVAQDGNLAVAPPPPGIGLTTEHRRQIYREVGEQQVQKAPESRELPIGQEVPSSLMLNEMPITLKDQVGVLRDFRFAKLPDEAIIIVDPVKRQVVDVVTKEEGTK